jgi:hypothetical protein
LTNGPISHLSCTVHRAALQYPAINFFTKVTIDSLPNMSSGKLDQTLDEILSTQRQAAGRRRSVRRSTRTAAKQAPVGGIQKNTKPARNAAKQVPTKATGPIGESKIIVSNLVSNLLPDGCQNPYANCSS